MTNHTNLPGCAPRDGERRIGKITAVRLEVEQNQLVAGIE
jgi:hypothetical protein